MTSKAEETFTERLGRLKELGAEPQTTVWDMSESDLTWLIEQVESRTKSLGILVADYARLQREYEQLLGSSNYLTEYAKQQVKDLRCERDEAKKSYQRVLKIAEELRDENERLRGESDD